MESKFLLLLLPLDAFGLWPRAFLPFFAYFFNTIAESNQEGGEVMEEDNDIFEMFLEVMEQLEPENPDGRMRVLSKDPRYAADDPAASKPKNRYIER